MKTWIRCRVRDPADKRCRHFVIQSCHWLAGRHGTKLIWGRASVCTTCGEFMAHEPSNDRGIDFIEVEMNNRRRR
jgi:hypothetical protein